MQNEFQDDLDSAAFAFRGYNTTNLGRSPELLAHPVYGTIVARHLEHGSQVCSEGLGRKVDLVERVRERRESSLDTFGEDMGLIISMELAQIELLEQLFSVRYADARLGLGYSLGEITALICGGVFKFEHLLTPLLKLAEESADLARDATMGILFSRGPALDLDAVRRLCLEINCEGHGIIAISAYLSPNSVLLLGQGGTVDRFKRLISDYLNGDVYLRKNQDRWPPLHTPLLWERNIPNRGAVMMHTIPGGFQAPVPPVLSLVTGKTSYNDFNSRELLSRWIDEPQRLWDVVNEILATGIELMIHVGPDPNLIPATFKRISDNIAAQLKDRSWNAIGLRAISGIARRPWVASMLSAKANLLRAPFVKHVILEDWLLEHPVK